MRKRLTDKFEKMQRNAAASGSRREISNDFKYDKAKLKHLKHVLHNVNVALGTIASALNEFSRVKGPDISPDGLLGGLGYIISIKDIKEKLNVSVKDLSDIADCIADELTNPRWDAEDDKDVKELIKEKEKVDEKVEEVPESSEENEEEQHIAPEDVVTSKDIEKEGLFVDKNDKKETVLASAVKRALVSFKVKEK